MGSSEYQKQWRAKNPGRQAEYQRRYRAKNPETKSDAAMDWARRHPERVKAKLGDSIEGLEKALVYLRAAYGR